MLVGGTYSVDCPTVEVYLLLVTIPLVGNIVHIKGFPLVLKGTDTTGAKRFPPSIESMG